MKKLTLLWILSLLFFSVAAQQLSLDDCKTLALQHNATLKNAALDIDAAKEVKKEAFTKYFPNINAMAGGYHALHPLIEYHINDLESAAARDLFNNLYFEYGAALGFNNSIAFCENGLAIGATAIQPVFTGGQIIHGNQLARLGVQAAQLKQQTSQDQVIQQIEENYWLIVSLQEKKQTLLQATIFLDTLYRDGCLAKEAGLITQNDVLKVTLKQNEIRTTLLKVNHGITLASIALCQSIGIPYSANITLTDTLSNIPISLPEWSDPTNSVQQRKETQLLNINVDAEQLRKKMLMGEVMPHLLVGMSFSYGNPIFKKYNANGLLFATLQVPLTNWWEMSHKLKQQDYTIQKAKNQRTDLMQKMALETQQSFHNVQEAASIVSLMKESVQLAFSNLQTLQINFDAGITTLSEVLEAQTMYRQTLDQLTDAKIDYQLKLSHYHRIAVMH